MNNKYIASRTVIVTGASGFIGRYFLDSIKESYKVIAIARRSSTEAGVPFHPNVNWVQWDISNKKKINEVMGYIIGKGGADTMVHLAAFYDFEYDDNPAYERINIQGTRNVLELSKKLGVRHFLFASSLTVCNFPPRDQTVSEQTPAEAYFSYAYSKAMGEKMALEYAQFFKCTVIRFAAVYSDWCEFAPLYKFLSLWLSGSWDSRFLAGKGESAISYIHIYDLSSLMLKVIEQYEKMPDYTILLASPDGSTSHYELFHAASRDYFGQSLKPILFPRLFCYPGLLFKQLLGRLYLMSRPYERVWMLKYIDLRLDVSASYTRELLSWDTTPRYHILRRLLFLLEKMKSHPNVWHLRNEAALKTATHRANLLIYENLILEQENILQKVTSYIHAPENIDQFPHYIKLNSIDFQSHLSILFHLLLATVRSGDRSLMLKYIDDVALQRFAEGFQLKEILCVLDLFDETIINILKNKTALSKMSQEIYDYITLTLQLARDEIEDVYENLEHKLSQYRIADMAVLIDNKKREEMIQKLSVFYQDSPEEVEVDTNMDELDSEMFSK